MEEGKLQDIQYWNPISGIYESIPPTFSVGHWGGLACRGVNLTGSTQEMYMTFSVIDPRGYLIDTWGTNIHIVPSGGGFSANYGVYCDIVGDYTMQCHLAIAEIGYVDSIWETICHVTKAEVEAFIDTWWLWDAVENDWVRPSPTLIPFGSDIGIKGRAWNKSNSIINMRMNIVTHSPSGKTQTGTGGVVEVSPGLYPTDYPCWDFLWEADEFGDWEADLILYAAFPGEALVEVDRRENISVASVQEAPSVEAKFSEFAVKSFSKV